MKLKVCLSLCLLSLTTPVMADNSQTSLVNQAQSAQQQERQHNRVRETSFQETEQTLRAEVKRLQKAKVNLQEEIDSLTSQFSHNESALAKQEEKLRLETGSLGEIFGVVRQNAKTLKSDLSHSITQIDRQTYAPVVDDIVAAKSLPSLKQLSGLWQSMNEQIRASGEVTQVKVPYVNESGIKSTEAAARLGSFGLIATQGYMNWDDNKQVAFPYLKQPDDSPTLNSIAPLLAGQTQSLVVDPSKGTLLAQLANVPTLLDRLKAGGVVGNIILGLLAIGLVIAILRGISLAVIKQKIKAQLKMPQQPGDNPLGRVLSVYDKEKHRSVEALELRLLEVVVDEQSHLEKGLSMLKLLAALAPMLGLLGTVTGMIETFQVITQFGNGDPKVMAGGISMALITTVLGLVAAMPMLLAHNILSSQAESIRTILEKQGIGLVAAQAENDQVSKDDLEHAA
ncbi:MotA/TolQ/ExbB proton channel family protein [Vibrio gazogenes]|uniref:Outer membrane transport energization protein ExbB (TC 2.C.1.1.1) n=1 Tax=Vibrio gazogenes DSM 21264 = NBRC 103151 TaxID=1123492 RepID=A0A1M4ZGY5_VIBGA|nr:MotA/TolQ/ExbB proton channel family protein [Vibrio gazogenes]USP12408.1 MotA/TolQ/ExbB proton channel family protein [Vibrio gazogenes]SHF17303.1 outer membrane transport energization protein ExbB (TC 2.C.1.1.1) [Vibrio gazogenes DSM 21264] [Vibrio gazogenes DSM 21264 = NBRC 103151]SJN53405.1 Biopolymer transport protein ExbB [Vibrio gazogenes]